MNNELRCIYVVTCVNLINEDIKETHAFGYYFDIQDAIECVKENYSDINEGNTFSHAVIEKTPQGMYPGILEEIWFKWNNEKEVYEECERPVMGTFRIVNFGLG